METYWMYSLRTGKLRIRQGETNGCHFMYEDDKGKHRITFTYDCKYGTNGFGYRGDVNDLLFMKERDDKYAIEYLLERQKANIEKQRKQLENLEKRIPYLENLLNEQD